MAESWVRLWAGMTTDPKWQTIARKSGQPRYLVIALFSHLLMVGNENEDRGSLSDLSIEDTASALDCDEEQVEAILLAMDGRVIEGGRLSGWAKRQPNREDSGNEATGALSSTERVRRFREKKRDETQGNETKRDETQGNAPEAEAEAEAEAEKKAAAVLQTPHTPTGPVDNSGIDVAALPSIPVSTDPVHARAIELSVLLRKRGAALQASDPHVRQWAADGVSDAEALTAMEVAQERRAEKGSPAPINSGLLNAILSDRRPGAQASMARARASPKETLEEKNRRIAAAWRPPEMRGTGS